MKKTKSTPWKDMITVSKAQARKVLTLYTINGYTQEQIGEAVFPARVERKLSRSVLARRVLHLFGLGMQNRSTYQHAGLTPAVIDEILASPTLAFPLLIPLNGEPEPLLFFYAEITQQIKGEGKYSSARGTFLNIAALVMIAVIQYIGLNFSADPLVILLPFGIYLPAVLLIDARDEDRNLKRKGGLVLTLIAILFIAFLFIRGYR